MIPILIICTIAYIVGVAIYVTKKLHEEKSIKQDGITVDAVVVKSTHRYKCFNTVVRFTGNDGLMHETTVITRSRAPEGYTLQIAYMPNQYDKAVLVTQESLWRGFE